MNTKKIGEQYEFQFTVNGGVFTFSTTGQDEDDARRKLIDILSECIAQLEKKA